jgi:hypothetical protein
MLLIYFVSGYVPNEMFRSDPHYTSRPLTNFSNDEILFEKSFISELCVKSEIGMNLHKILSSSEVTHDHRISPKSIR